ncbi:hypothetical protein RZS08_32765 [Arthrospira platensis SPKY1]|nr:hypothetical protein [Arthrospira platensis SPKY1]
MEDRLSRLIISYENVQSERRELLDKIEKMSQENDILKNQIISLGQDIESMKMTNALLGSEDFKRDTKLKINSLIKDIDDCIAHFAE